MDMLIMHRKLDSRIRDVFESLERYAEARRA